jgi:hypothetical protein
MPGRRSPVAPPLRPRAPYQRSLRFSLTHRLRAGQDHDADAGHGASFADRFDRPLLTRVRPSRTMRGSMFEPRRALMLASAAFFFAGCAAPKPLAQLNAQGSMVHVGKERPASSATALGYVEGDSGSGCAGFGTIGTYETAEADLRNRTAAIGGDYAQIVAVLPPHDTGAPCPDNRMVIRGMAYRMGESAAGTATAPPAAPSVASAAAPSGASSAPSVSSAASASTAPPAAVCDPPCSPGYTCSAGSCVALCNPPCGPGQICRADRLCVPGS